LTTVSEVSRDSSSIRVDCRRVCHAELAGAGAYATVLNLSKTVICITSQSLSFLQAQHLSFALLTIASGSNGPGS